MIEIFSSLTAFNVPHLEKNPTATVDRPKTGDLAQPVNILSEEEEVHVQQVLSTLQVCKPKLTRICSILSFKFHSNPKNTLF